VLPNQQRWNQTLETNKQEKLQRWWWQKKVENIEENVLIITSLQFSWCKIKLTCLLHESNSKDQALSAILWNL
jgi:hypothetical protein